MTNVTPSDKFERLRHQAQELLNQSHPASSKKQVNIDDLFHELSIHQTELEIQNQELQRSQAEYTLLHKEFSDLYEFAPCGYLTLNAKGIITRANLTATSLLKESRKKIHLFGMNHFIREGYHDVYYGALRESGQTGKKQSIEIPIKHKRDTPCWLRLDMEVDRDGDVVIQWRITLVDISDQKEAEKNLRRAKGEWEQTFDSISDNILILDRELRIVRANRATFNLLQVEPQDVLKKRCYEVFQCSKKPCHNCPGVNTWKDLKHHSEVITYERLGLIFRVTASPFVNEGGSVQHIVLIAQNITEQIKLEEELSQAHKMEAVGTLAGGIAHDFNNSLAIIFGFSELALGNIPTGNPARDDINEVLIAGKRAKDLVRQILTFSHKKVEDLGPMQPAPIIKEGVKLLRSSLPTTVDIVEVIDKSTGLINFNPIYMHQVLVNLCTNALHAMRDGKGILTIKLSRVELAANDLQNDENIEHGSFVRLTVDDTGSGIAPNSLKKIFDPYYTTKDVGEGSGMGLATVHGIVKGCGGFIDVESEIGRGSTFNVFLPVIEDDLISGNKEDKERIPPFGEEKILVVDDEHSIVKVYKRSLELFGYQVSAHVCCDEALEEIRNSDQGFDLIITDQTMPLTTGDEFSREVMKILPDIPIILCTGYSNIMDEDKAKEIGVAKFVQKPVSSKDLAFIVREVLDSHRK